MKGLLITNFQLNACIIISQECLQVKDVQYVYLHITSKVIRLCKWNMKAELSKGAKKGRKKDLQRRKKASEERIFLSIFIRDLKKYGLKRCLFENTTIMVNFV